MSKNPRADAYAYTCWRLRDEQSADLWLSLHPDAGLAEAGTEARRRGFGVAQEGHR